MKPLIEVKSVNKDGEFSKLCVDFDALFAISPLMQKIRLAGQEPGVINGTVLMFKGGKEMFVTNDYDSLMDQWIKLTHPCVQSPG